MKNPLLVKFELVNTLGEKENIHVHNTFLFKCLISNFPSRISLHVPIYQLFIDNLKMVGTFSSNTSKIQTKKFESFIVILLDIYVNKLPRKD